MGRMKTLTAYAALKTTDPFHDLRTKSNRVRFALEPRDVKSGNGQEAFRISLDLPDEATYQVFDISRGHPTFGFDNGIEEAIGAARMATEAGRASVVQVVTLLEDGRHKAEPLTKYVVTISREVSETPDAALQADRREQLARIIAIHQETWCHDRAHELDGLVTFECECGHTERIRFEDDEITRARHCADKLIEAGI